MVIEYFLTKKGNKTRKSNTKKSIQAVFQIEKSNASISLLKTQNINLALLKTQKINLYFHVGPKKELPDFRHEN